LISIRLAEGTVRPSRHVSDGFDGITIYGKVRMDPTTGLPDKATRKEIHQRLEQMRAVDPFAWMAPLDIPMHDVWKNVSTNP